MSNVTIRNGYVVHGFELDSMYRDQLRFQGLEQVLSEKGREVWIDPKSAICKFNVSDKAILIYNIGIDDNDEINFSAHHFTYVDSKNNQKELYVKS